MLHLAAFLLVLLSGLALPARPVVGAASLPAAETEQYRPDGLPAAAAMRPSGLRFASPADGPAVGGGPRAAGALVRGVTPTLLQGLQGDRVEERRSAAVPRYRAHRAPRC